ncbi:AMP-binding protein, partial [Streptomyces beijiangensis]
LDVVSGAEREQVLNAPDDTAAPLPGLTVPQLFARQVERDPAAVAGDQGDGTLSYQELDERSDRLAGALRRRQIGPGSVVAVALPRSAGLPAALLRVVKAGAACLPV